jgi:hypothetical protein
VTTGLREFGLRRLAPVRSDRRQLGRADPADVGGKVLRALFLCKLGRLCLLPFGGKRRWERLVRFRRRIKIVIRGHRFLVSALFGLRSTSWLDQRSFGDRLILIVALRLRQRLNFGDRTRILVPAVLARCAADLPPLRRDRAVLDHILRSAIWAGEDHMRQKTSSGTVSAG